jgi:hypothetical protein
MLPETNKLRTPPRSDKSTIKFNLENNPNNISNNSNDLCKIHLAELYTTNKKLEKLTNELEEKTKNEIILSSRLGELDRNLNEKIKQNLIEINEQKILISDLLNKIKILEQSNNYYELIEYYENKFSEQHLKNINNIQMFTQIINKITSESILNNRDEVWRNLVKKYENKIMEMENEKFEYMKKDRKIQSRQKFFEKYCYKAEEKIEKFSKISKKFFDQETQLKYVQNELEKYKKDFTVKINEKDNMKKELDCLKSENSNMKNFVNKIKPILKIDWEEIKKSNEENYQILLKNNNPGNSSQEEVNFNSKNIIILLNNLKDFLLAIKENLKSKEIDIDMTPVTQIIDDVKHYTIMLFQKIQLMAINQYNVINTTCELNDKITNFSKNNKISFDFINLLKDIRNACSKLLFDYNPK